MTTSHRISYILRVGGDLRGYQVQFSPPENADGNVIPGLKTSPWPPLAFRVNGSSRARLSRAGPCLPSSLVLYHPPSAAPCLRPQPPFLTQPLLLKCPELREPAPWACLYCSCRSRLGDSVSTDRPAGSGAQLGLGEKMHQWTRDWGARTWGVCRERGARGFCHEHVPKPLLPICPREIPHDKPPHWQLEFENWSGRPLRSLMRFSLPFAFRSLIAIVLSSIKSLSSASSREGIWFSWPPPRMTDSRGAKGLASEGCCLTAFSPPASLAHRFLVLSPKAQGLPAYRL